MKKRATSLLLALVLMLTSVGGAFAVSSDVLSIESAPREDVLPSDSAAGENTLPSGSSGGESALPSGSSGGENALPSGSSGEESAQPGGSAEGENALSTGSGEGAGLPENPLPQGENPGEIAPENGPIPYPQLPDGITLVSDGHPAYIQGAGRGYFKPDGELTRAEAAVILLRLLSDNVPVSAHYVDVPANAWYAKAAEQLGSLGVIRPNETEFLGDEPVTRGEFTRYVASFFPQREDADLFPDVSPADPDALFIRSARAYGWVSGYADGSFRPQEHLHRSEAVAILNRALGRSADMVLLSANHPALYLDVIPTAWYYGDVMEAAVPHNYMKDEEGRETAWESFTPVDTGLPADFRTAGRHLYDGWSYYYDAAAEDIVRNGERNGFTFDAAGHFTSGDPGVDSRLRAIILSQTNPSMSQEEMLKSLFAYCRDHFTYRKREYYPKGDTSFMLKSARVMLETGKGNCYCFASVFWYLSRWLGYDAKIYSGGLGTGADPHSWVEISFDGVPYIYDTQLEWRMVHDRGRSSYYWFFYHYPDNDKRWIYTR